MRLPRATLVHVELTRPCWESMWEDLFGASYLEVIGLFEVQLPILLGVRGSVSESRDQIPPLSPCVTKASAVEFLQSSISAAAAPAVSAVSDYLQISPLPKCGGSIPHSVAPAIYCFIRKLSSPPGFEPTTSPLKVGHLDHCTMTGVRKQTLLDLC